MAWVTFTADDVRSRMMDDEIENYECAGDQTPTVKRLTAIVQDVIELIRGKVKSCHLNKNIGTAGTIPSELRGTASILCRHALMASVPNTSELEGSVRKDEYEKACSTLNQVARCEFKIDSEGLESSSTTTDNQCVYGGNPLLDF